MSISLSNLQGYWRLDEGSNVNRADSSGNGNTLLDVNTVAAAAGKVDNGALFVAANSETLQIADNALLSCGDIDFMICAWVKLTSKPVVNGVLVSKDDGGTHREYDLQWNTALDRFRFLVSADGATTTAVTASTIGAPNIGQWYFIVAWHDATANTINIQVNDGTADSAAHTTGCHDDTSSFCLGSAHNTLSFADATIDEVSFWKRILTTGERTELYNSGFGNTYPFTVSTVTKTVKPGGGGDYTSLAAWQTARIGNLRGRNTIEVADCYGGDVDPIVLDGWDTDATRYVRIQGTSSAKHAGVLSTSASIAHLSAGATTALEIREDYTQVGDLSIDGSAALFEIIDAASCLIERCVMDGAAVCVHASGTSGSNVVKNCIVTGSDIAVHADGASAAVTVRNCTLQCSESGGGAFKVSNGGTITEQNNYVKVTSGSVYTTVAGTFNKGANTATSNTEATTVGLRSIAFSTANFLNVTNGTENLHLTQNSALVGLGADLSGSGVTVDIDNASRSTPFDIGADELVLGGSPLFVYS